MNKLRDDAKNQLINKGIVTFSENDEAYGHPQCFFKHGFDSCRHWLANALTRIQNPGDFQTDLSQTPYSATCVVVGCGRGGTSIISGVLHHLGVFMGDNACAPVYEDTKLASAIKQKDVNKMQQIIDNYNARYPVWGFKRPETIRQLPRLHRRFRNPKYVFIFRDMLAIGNRGAISMRSDLITNMQQALADYQAIMRFIQAYRPEAMLVSNEKLLQNKALFVDSLCDFVGIQAGNEQKRAALDFIEPDPISYLDTSRITKAVGCLQIAPDGTISGWAKLIHDARPVLLEVYLNNQLIMDVLANQFRQDLVEQGLHPSGYAGFSVTLPNPPNAGDWVRVRAKYDVDDIGSHQF